jgi:UDP-GlcNAc:undecaprenyl-phosphate GlcNAc-1-phosphate transferase
LLDASLAAFWLLSTVNAFNLIDGLDGLAAGVGIAAAAAITLIGVTHGDAAMTFQGLAIGGALAGFMLFNLHPASIFMGDCGALALGLLLGAIALRAGGLAALQSRPSRYVVPILIMLVPLLDIAIVSVSRMATGAPISRRGLDHSHHRLLLLGLPVRRAVAVCWGVATLSAVSAVVLATMPHFYVVATLPFIALAAGLIALFMIDLTFDSNAPGIAHENLRGPARFILTFAYKRRMAEAALDFALILAAYFGAFLIRLDFKMDNVLVAQMVTSAPWVLVASYVAFLAAGVYRGMWRYAGFADVLRFANGSLLAGILVLVESLFTLTLLSGTIEVLFVILLFNLLVGSRLSFRALRKGIALLAPASERVLIVGIGELGEAAARYITSRRSRSLRLVGFADDDGFKLGKLVHGRSVLGSLDDLEKIHAASQFNQVLVAAEALAPERMRLVLSFANLHHVAVRKFSIKLSEVELANDSAGANGTAGPIARGTSAPGVLT